MIVDQRTYTIQIGLVRDFLALYAAEGLPVQSEHLGPPLGYYTTEVGEVNEVVHLWQYTDMADRERRRAALEADPRWLAYRRKAGAAGQVLRQRNAILRAVDFKALVPARPA
ncbi:NIPSNAP family protein [Ramlibacter sp. USB13]|uniref:NIPSNAP family protein n=1 Tax=Ramlibacter cellulosilyticus TaxID=2764187 RepID=A0A923MTT4_9BURK|nr:NIPSNAP family protein [Ramlibacter cellulosilyticus]MBC5784638.1 NIPSNAP family protein [Ramlibacter cellulosilyticus]